MVSVSIERSVCLSVPERGRWGISISRFDVTDKIGWCLTVVETPVFPGSFRTDEISAPKRQPLAMIRVQCAEGSSVRRRNLVNPTPFQSGVTTRFQRMFRSKVIAAQRFRIIDLVPRGQASPQIRGPSLGSEEGPRGPEAWSRSDPRHGR